MPSSTPSEAKTDLEKIEIAKADEDGHWST